EAAQAVVLDEVAGQFTLPVEVGDLDVVEVVEVVALLARPREHEDGAAPGDPLELLRGHGTGHHGEAVDTSGDLGDEALGTALEGGGDEEGVPVPAGGALHAADDLVGVEHRRVV